MQFTVWNPTTGKVISRGVASSLDEAMMYELNGMRVKLGVALDPMTQAIDPTDESAISLPASEPPVTTSSVNVERDRRIALGFEFGGKLFQVDLPAITGAMASATAAMLNGAADGELRWSDPDRDFRWIAIDNTSLTMDARTTIMFGQAGLAFNSAHVTAARAIKDRMLAGDTLTITDDALWPSRTV